MRLVTIAIILILATSAAYAANSDRNFGGVGIDGEPRADGEIVVRQVVAGGPAALAGIRTGDIVTHIDGKATRGSDFTQMVQFRLRGRSGTKVLLTIHRPGEPRPRKLTLTRRQLVVPTADRRAKTGTGK